MTFEAKVARSEYRRKWAANNKEKIKEYQRRYWEKKAANLNNPGGKGDTNDQHTE